METKYFDSDFDFDEWSNECLQRYTLPEIGSQREYDGNFSHNWEDFYTQHESGNFFKPRKYLCEEFREYLEKCQRLLEVGCGYGCSIYPLADKFPLIEFIATDYSQTALTIFQSNRKFNSSRISVCQWDVTVPLEIECEPVDVVLMVFALSAVHPSNHLTSLQNISKKLSNGSYILFRDYGVCDMTMYRHSKRLSEHLFERTDGTLSYYFELESFKRVVLEANLTVVEMKYATVINRNRKTREEMRRVFLHAVLQKKSSESSEFDCEVSENNCEEKCLDRNEELNGERSFCVNDSEVIK